MKHEVAPLLGSAEELFERNQPKPADFYGMEIEHYLDLNFGSGCWVRDPFEDKYIIWTGAEDGGPSYIVMDREYRRYPVTIPASRVH